jgi:hypothetical protein
MNKRIRKKFHKVHLNELVYEVSVSSFWREKIFQSDHYKKHTINKYHNEEIENPLRSIIDKYNLEYYVSLIPHEEAIGWQDWDATQIYIKFESVEFPSLIGYSANNPYVI